LLSEAIQSVLQQTFEDFELIIVDDGSTDNTAEVVAGFADQRIIYHYQNKQERGAARNRGFALSNAEYVTFLDDDDWFMPRKLEVQVRGFRDFPEAGMIISGWDRIDEAGRIVRAERPWLHHPQPKLNDWLFAAMAHVAAVLIRREWFERVSGFNHDLAPNEDTYLWFCLAQADCPIGWVKEVVFRQRLHGGNSVRNMAHVKAGKIAMLETIFSDLEASKTLGMSKESALAKVHMGFASLEYGADCIEDAKVDLARAVEYDPSLLLNDADRLLESIAAYAWNHMTGEPEDFTNRVFANLPDELSELRRLRRKAVARTWMVGAFRAYQHHDMPRVRQSALRAVATAPTSLLNPGLASILAQSLLGSSRLDSA
jgi:hypothetical protein